MKLYTLKRDGKDFIAVESIKGNYIPLSDIGLRFDSMNELIENSTRDVLKLIEKASLDERLAERAVSHEDGKAIVCAPIPVPRQDIICLGVNYRDHLAEIGDVVRTSEKNATVYFSKRVNEAVGDNGIIPDYDFVENLDYEAELCVVLGRDARNIKAEDAKEYIFGYSIMNDITSRDIQKRHIQWYRGKSLDGYTSMGPCIVTADSLDAQNLDICCYVNGEKRQSSNTRYMIQSIAGAIEELSQGMTLKKGTIISTGTPGGVGMGMNPPAYLKSGDRVECYVEGIGTLTNIIG